MYRSVEALQSPFVIRGHHLVNVLRLHDTLFRKIPLFNFWQFAESGIDPFLKSNASKWILQQIIELHSEELVLRVQQSRDEYTSDVLGNTDEQRKYFKSTYEALLYRYVHLRGDAVAIATADKDNICTSCAIGLHCPSHGTAASLEDLFIINKIAIFHDQNNLEHSVLSVLREGEEHHQFEYQSDGALFSIRTNMSSLRDFLRNWRS